MPKRKIKVLVIGGHTEGFHQFKLMRPIYKKFLGKAGFNVTLTEDWDNLKPEAIKPYDVIIGYTTGENLTDEQRQGLMNGIVSGKGFVGIHSAADSFKETPGYINMVGGKFLTHPAQIKHRFKVLKKSHPIMKGVKDFTMVEELYLMETYGHFDLLMSAKYKGIERPIAWVKGYGHGRVFYLALGHGEEQTSNPNFQKLMVNGVRWAVNPDR